MAITATNLTTAGDGTDLASYATASVTPASNNLVLVWAYSIAAAAAVTPTMTGNGLTWVQVASIDDAGNGTGLRRITLFRAMGAAPTAGGITISFGTQTQTGCAWSVAQYTGMDTTGTNGSGAIVQSATNFVATTATSVTVTLAAFASVNNATTGGFGMPLNTAALPAVGAGFTLIGQINQLGPNLSLGSEFNAGNNTTVDMNAGAATVPWAAIAAEIKQAGAAISHNLTLLGVGK